MPTKSLMGLNARARVGAHLLHWLYFSKLRPAHQVHLNASPLNSSWVPTRPKTNCKPYLNPPTPPDF